MPDDLPSLPASSASSTELSPEQRRERLLWIAGRVKTLLASFWDPREDEALEAAVLDDWITVLEGLPERHVQDACIAYLANPPRTKSGAPRRPIPGDILMLAKRFEARDRPRPMEEPRAAEPARERADPERVTKMMREAGYLTPEQAEAQLAAIRADRGTVIPMPTARRIPHED